MFIFTIVGHHASSDPTTTAAAVRAQTFVEVLPLCGDHFFASDREIEIATLYWLQVVFELLALERMTEVEGFEFDYGPLNNVDEALNGGWVSTLCEPALEMGK